QQIPLLIEYRSEIVDLYVSSNNESSLRSTSKLIMRLLELVFQEITSDEQGNILEKAFQLIEQHDCPVALLVNCWDILLLLSVVHPWIREELKLHITFYLERHATPASKS